jgi:hypothetical protein
MCLDRHLTPENGDFSFNLFKFSLNLGKFAAKMSVFAAKRSVFAAKKSVFAAKRSVFAATEICGKKKCFCGKKKCFCGKKKYCPLFISLILELRGGILWLLYRYFLLLYELCGNISHNKSENIWTTRRKNGQDGVASFYSGHMSDVLANGNRLFQRN